MKRNLKIGQPTSLLDALRMEKEHARVQHNLSVERIADKMGVTHHDLYKWLGTGRMPVILVPSYETVCGGGYVSRWLALSAGRLVIDMPTGRSASSADINMLQQQLTDAVSGILRFTADATEAAAVLSAIHIGMAGLAWHKVNIEKSTQPELQFGGDE